jgi:hypothetical protein
MSIGIKIAPSTIQALGKIITGGIPGDSNISPYRTGQRLVEFFNQHGGNSLYGHGFPSRWQFAENSISELNGTKHIKEIIEDAVDPRHYLNTNFKVSDTVEYLNKYLIHDKFEIIKNGPGYIVKSLSDKSNIEKNLVEKLDREKASHAYILEQSNKCREKLESGDYDGVITNSRTMVEAVFEDILKNLNIKIPEYDGNLNKIYKEVKEHLNLDPSKKDLSNTIKEILSGLISIVNGLSGISNKMGDRHARTYKPEKHHASLASNVAYALCEFLLSSMNKSK